MWTREGKKIKKKNKREESHALPEGSQERRCFAVCVEEPGRVCVRGASWCILVRGVK